MSGPNESLPLFSEEVKVYYGLRLFAFKLLDQGLINEEKFRVLWAPATLYMQEKNLEGVMLFCLSRIWKIASFGLALPERRFPHEQAASSLCR